jgi:hypothetical protein
MEGVDLRADPPGDELRVAGEAEVDEPFPAGDRVADERLYERDVILDGIDLPDDVVARQDPREDPVEAGQPGAQRLRFPARGQDVTPRTDRSAPSALRFINSVTYREDSTEGTRNGRARRSRRRRGAQ